MAGEWDTILQEWGIDTGYICAAGLAQRADGNYYAAAPVADEAGWGLIYKDPHAVEVLQDDGVTTKEVTVTESELLLQAINQGRVPTGLYVAGTKYKVVQVEKEFDVANGKLLTILATRPKGGLHIVATEKTICVGLYNEELGQQSGNARNTVIAIGDYLLQSGY